jgi:hypothetical protein
MATRTLYYLGIFVAAIVAVGASEQRGASGKDERASDRLLSFTYAFNKEIRPIVEAKLLQSSASHGRMIKLPSFPEIAESAVSVDCPASDDQTAACRVILTQAKSNMENTMMEYWGDPDAIRKVEAIVVVRREAAIPKRTANAFRDCLRVMIPEPGDPLKLHPATITDNDRIEFWLEEPNVAPRKGERAEKPGRRSKILIRIGDLLVHYCEEPESQRSRIAKQIEADAARILGNRNAK